MSVRVITGDCRTELAKLADESVNCVVTSPPYFGLRDYGVDGQIGLEPTPDAFVAELVSVFQEVRRVLMNDGTCWLNLGDSYSQGGNGGGAADAKQRTNVGSLLPNAKRVPGYLPKQLLGIPWRVAFALQADGWYLRQDIIWSKPNPMPESVQDRCTKAHEYVFLLSKSPRYYYDADAIAEDATSGRDDMRSKGLRTGAAYLEQQGPQDNSVKGRASGNKAHKYVDQYEADEGEQHRTKAGLMKIADIAYDKRNARSVWTITTQPFSEAHFATFPPELAERCIKAGCLEGGTVLDPFFGAGTSGLVADRLGRNCIGIELNPAYAEIARNRISKDAGMFAELSA